MSEKNEVKFHHNSFKCIFFAFELLVKDAMTVGLQLSTDTNKITF